MQGHRLSYRSNMLIPIGGFKEGFLVKTAFESGRARKEVPRQHGEREAVRDTGRAKAQRYESCCCVWGIPGVLVSNTKNAGAVK